MKMEGGGGSTPLSTALGAFTLTCALGQQLAYALTRYGPNQVTKRKSSFKVKIPVRPWGCIYASLLEVMHEEVVWLGDRGG